MGEVRQEIKPVAMYKARASEFAQIIEGTASVAATAMCCAIFCACIIAATVANRLDRLIDIIEADIKESKT